MIVVISGRALYEIHDFRNSVMEYLNFLCFRESALKNYEFH